MHGRSRIRQQLLADAHQLKQQIAQLERDLLSPGGGGFTPIKFTEVSYQIRRRKSRLYRLERCICALQPRPSLSDNRGSPSATVDNFDHGL